MEVFWIPSKPLTRENLDMGKAVCKLCRKEYAYKGNTTNSGFHIDHDHKESLSTTRDVNANDIKTSNKQPTLAEFTCPKVAMSASKREAVDDALIKLLVGKVLPLSLVENSFFKTFVKELNPSYVVPTRKVVTAKLATKKCKAEETVREELKAVHNVAITHDSWTSLNTESYSTVTGHFINENWNLESVVLETKKIEGSHTGENIKSCLMETQCKWSLPNRIAVTDNAANENQSPERTENQRG